jgi:SAM-dependent methyltransferase
MTNYPSDYVRYTWEMLNGHRVRGEQGLARIRERDIASYLDVRKPIRILDLANGRLRPQYIILNAAGHKVYGIDLVNRPERTRVDLAYAIARGFFYLHTGWIGPKTGNHRLVCGDVRALPFPNDYFDLITSIAAFEHFLDVPTVLAEMRRILRVGGLAWVNLHPFTSLSGGHNLNLTEIPLRHVPDGVDAWDHLRKRKLGFTATLNEWRLDQYVEEFSRQFEVVKQYCLMREGEELLTPELEAELSTYKRDELTCGAYIIVALKSP